MHSLVYTILHMYNLLRYAAHLLRTSTKQAYLDTDGLVRSFGEILMTYKNWYFIRNEAKIARVSVSFNVSGNKMLIFDISE